MAEFERKIETIDGRQFEVRMMPARRGRKVLMRLARVVGPALAAMVDGKDLRSVADLGAMDVNLAGLIKNLTEDLTETDLDWFCDEFAAFSAGEMEAGSGQLVDLSTGVNFDLLFAGRYMTMLKWLKFCLEVNLGGFFSEPGTSEGPGAGAAKPRR